MMRDRLPLILSTTALLVAVLGMTPLGEAAYNAVVPRNSVGTLQLQRNAVKAAKIAPNAIRTGHVLDGSLLTADFKAGQIPQGPKGDKGDKGDRGAVGVSGYEIVRASVVVPPNTQTAAQATCPSGKKVLGGAASVQEVPTGVSIHTQVTEVGASSSYDAIFTNASAVSRQLNATAICAIIGS
jgi:hypothetical protein